MCKLRINGTTYEESFYQNNFGKPYDNSLKNIGIQANSEKETK
jgi:hypothetical protein